MISYVHCTTLKIVVFIGSIKDTILRSTISDYFENEPDGRLTARVYPPPVTKNATPVADLPSSNFEIGNSN